MRWRERENERRLIYHRPRSLFTGDSCLSAVRLVTERRRWRHGAAEGETREGRRRGSPPSSPPPPMQISTYGGREEEAEPAACRDDDDDDVANVCTVDVGTVEGRPRDYGERSHAHNGIAKHKHVLHGGMAGSHSHRRAW